MSWFGGLLSGIGSAVGGWLGYKGSKDRNVAQTAASERQMAFQERMARNAHQYEVEDLKKAGLNPILSAKYGGSATPPGAMPALENVMTGIQGGMSSAKSFADIKYTRSLAKTEQTKQGVNAKQEEYLDRQNSLLDEYIKRAKIDTKVRRQVGDYELNKYGRYILSPLSATMKHIGRIFGPIFSAKALGSD